jgi:hypothetical protein
MGNASKTNGDGGMFYIALAWWERKATRNSGWVSDNITIGPLIGGVAGWNGGCDATEWMVRAAKLSVSAGRSYQFH